MSDKKSVRSIIGNKAAKYQKIKLGNGHETGGIDRSNTANKIFPKSMKGLSMLDVGCNIGSFCIEAKKRGAGRVVGVDAVEEKIKVARSIAEHMNHDITYCIGNAEEWQPSGHFDLITLLNVIHHIDDPICLLRKLCKHVKDTLVIEFPGLMFPPKARDPKQRPFFQKLDSMSLISVMVNENKKGSVVPYRYLFSPEALTRILLHTVGFKSAKAIPSPFKPKENRHIIFARK